MFCVKEPARYVSTCPELSANFTHSSVNMDCQSKLLSRNLESRTDSAPSVLPVPHTANDTGRPSASQSVAGVDKPESVADATDTHDILTWQSVADVGMAESTAHATQCVTDVNTPGVNLTGQQGEDILVASDHECDMAASCQPPQVSDTATSVTHMTDAPVQLSQTEPSSESLQIDAVAVCTSTPQKSTGVVTSNKMVLASVGGTDIPAEHSSFVYHEENACDNMIGMSSITATADEYDRNFTACASQRGVVGNSEHIDRVPCPLSSNEPVISSAELRDSGNRRMFAVIETSSEMPYIDDHVKMSDASMSVLPPCAIDEEAMVVTEDGSLSAAVGGSEVYQRLTAEDDNDDVADTMMSFSSAVAECDESHSTLNDSRLVSITSSPCRVFKMIQILHTVIDVRVFCLCV